MDFLKSYFLEDLSICDDLIELHKESEDKGPGCFYNLDSAKVIVNNDIKESVDLELDAYDSNMKKVVYDYLVELQKICDKYIEEFPASNMYGRWTIHEPFNIQYYPPNGGYKVYHTERIGAGSNRHLAFMTYLNDVTDQGETEFYHQKYKIKPEKGKTVIWPAEWTYTHRGIPSPSQEKYIVTGWYSFY